MAIKHEMPPRMSEHKEALDIKTTSAPRLECRR